LRRFTAARKLGWTSIGAFVRSVNADDAYVVDLVENLQRVDLSAEEEADALVELVRTRGWTLDQVAAAVKRSPGYISKRVRLFEDMALREAVLQRGLAVSTAELLLGVAASQRSPLIDRAIAEQWDQMRVRDELQSAQSPVPGPKPARRPPSGAQPTRVVQARGAAEAQPGSRPPGFTRKVREFYRTMLTIRSEDLTPADRSAMRALFKALVMLARAQTTATPPVFPPFPKARTTGGQQTRSSAVSRRRKG
jgi:ParB-like chromosome segregation protein Spo0J